MHRFGIAQPAARRAPQENLQLCRLYTVLEPSRLPSKARERFADDATPVLGGVAARQEGQPAEHADYK